MKEVFAHRDFTRVGFYKSILDEAGITNFIRNQDVSAAEVVAPIFDPALVVEDEDYDRAMALLKTAHEPEEPTGQKWKCGKCGEEVPANFDTCWSCGSERPQ